MIGVNNCKQYGLQVVHQELDLLLQINSFENWRVVISSSNKTKLKKQQKD